MKKYWEVKKVLIREDWNEEKLNRYLFEGYEPFAVSEGRIYLKKLK